MKVQIQITGQISGNYKLLSHLNNGSYEDSIFNSKVVYYSTVKEAKTAIKKAYKSLKDADNKWLCRKSNDNTFIKYDASKAEIIKQEN